ncbi:hypothetical protein L202_02870 [Cryptococcus amylolentus CBS 6039]|uniref:Cns1/TTC4 wheel domain-containing protein n=1 Tax=Cryptococcus amylolentus CBS 6039 TaxID=1295533 RepID=A0A1E3HWN6_9TREE|nr:hypothetical protein L202_02870 [Cryptococcus amylolentus CBS 6039]ODN80704.1 hypothetical protein L202_02870 [Cryptococcus amylolentus CBS 6039]
MSAEEPDFLDQLIAAHEANPNPSQKEVTYEDFQKVLDSTPLFMRETPEEGPDGNHPILDALKTLVFDGEGDEVALNLKNHGNELYGQKSYADAIVAYTQAIDAKPADHRLRITLYNNRAACHLMLKKYSSVLEDTSSTIAIYSAGKKSGLDQDKGLVKALWRSAQALVALRRWQEAGDVIPRGADLAKEVGEDTEGWDKLRVQVEKGIKQVEEQAERLRRETMTKLALKQAVSDRGLIILDTPSPPDNPNPPHFDPDSIPPTDAESGWAPPPPHTPVVFPVFLLYPSYSQSDFITHFHENSAFEDQLAVMFPTSFSNPQVPWADWDEKHEYYVPNLVLYVETSERRLLKVGKELTLREVLLKAKRDAKGSVKKDGVVLRDGLLSFVILIKGAQEKAWIEEFKKARDAAQ